MTKLLDRFVLPPALWWLLVILMLTVQEPYVLKVTQAEFDKWESSLACCPTGVARRIQGVPLLIKYRKYNEQKTFFSIRGHFWGMDCLCFALNSDLVQLMESARASAEPTTDPVINNNPEPAAQTNDNAPSATGSLSKSRREKTVKNGPSNRRTR